MYSGKDKEEFLDLIEKLDQQVKVESVVGPSDIVTLTCKKKGGRLTNWNVSVGYCQEGHQIFSGRGVTGLEKALEMTEASSTLKNGYHVLCFKGVERTARGYHVTFWDIDPEWPYAVAPNGIRIPTLEIPLLEEEYRSVMQTKLALYDSDKEKKVIYPFSDSSLVSLNKQLKLPNYTAEMHLLPIALMLADRLDSAEALSVYTRYLTQRVRPVIGMANYRLGKISQKEFFQKVFDRLADWGIYSMSRWDVSVGSTTTDIELKNPFLSEWTLLVSIVHPENPSECISASLLLKHRNSNIVLCSKSVQNKENAGVDKLLNAFPAEIKSVRDMLTRIDGKDCNEIPKENKKKIAEEWKAIYSLIPSKKQRPLPEMKGDASAWFFESCEMMFPFIKDYRASQAGYHVKAILEQMAKTTG